MPSILLQFSSPSLRQLAVTLCFLQPLLQAVAFFNQLSHKLFSFLPLADHARYFCLQFLNLFGTNSRSLSFNFFNLSQKFFFSGGDKFLGLGYKLISLSDSCFFLLNIPLYFGYILSYSIDEITFLGTLLFFVCKIFLKVITSIL